MSEDGYTGSYRHGKTCDAFVLAPISKPAMLIIKAIIAWQRCVVNTARQSESKLLGLHNNCYCCYYLQTEIVRMYHVVVVLIVEVVVVTWWWLR